MFEPLPADFDFPAAERRVREFWEKHDIFAESLRRRAGAPRFVFYEGPPTANGLPHPGHALTRVIKDIFPRYKTMAGFLCDRKAGWDTHGLPVEVEVCKELGIHTKEEIEKYGIEKFNFRCINSVWRYMREWETLTKRLGFWVNLEEAYATYHQYYVESVWWSLKTLFDRGLLYQGHKIVWWWCQGGTALSAGEVGLGYRTTDDPSVFVKFPLVEHPGGGGFALKGGTGFAHMGGTGFAHMGGTGFQPVHSRGIGAELEMRRRKLPHWELGGSTYFVTFRSAGAEKQGDGSVRSQELLPEERNIVLSACLHFDRERVDVHATVVMPDHVHMLITPREKSPGEWWSLSDLLHSIKSFSANKIRELRSRRPGAQTGPVWQNESFDRIIRTPEDFEEKFAYISRNPTKRGLQEPYPWLFVETESQIGDRQDACPTPASDADPTPASDADPTPASDADPNTGPYSAVKHPPKRTSLLVWTTTPWTLISNHFAAVNPDLEYALVHDPVDDEYLYIAAALVETIAKKVKRELHRVSSCKGSELLDLLYFPPFRDVYHSSYVSRGTQIGWRVLAADFVTIDSGTGLVHEAPAFGEVDFDVLQKERAKAGSAGAIPLLCAVNPDGTFNHDAPERYRGRWIKDCDKDIIRELRDERKTPWGTPLLYHQETYRHEYPFCWRASDDPLIQYARKSWFVKTSQFKEEFLKNNAQVNWLPDHIKDGRFGDFLRNNVDWALSRERYWGTPLPIWVCEMTGKMEAIGSYDELRAKPGATDATAEYPQGFWNAKVAEHQAAGDAEMPEHLRVHKPYIDAWTYDSPFADGARMRRVTEVIDCWWDAGSMPFAQWGFPHRPGSVETLAQRWPADFISEAIDQTRGWFYGLLAINTLLRDDIARITQGCAGETEESLSSTEGTAREGSMGLRPVRPTTMGEPQSGVMSHRRVNESLIIRERILPHWEAGGKTYVVTIRVQQGVLTPEERTIVLNACRHWDGTRIDLHCVVVMPDHVHMLCTPREKTANEWWSLADLMHSIKNFSAHEINRRRGASGPVWQQEYYDRIIRSAEDFDEKWNYVVTNPRRAGLPDDYSWIWAEGGAPEQSAAGGSQTHGPEAHATRAVGAVENSELLSKNPQTLGPEAHATRANLVSAPQYPLPYRTCIVLGHILGEDGNKMSKSLRNYKEPSYVFDSYGADALRWLFLSVQAPWATARFQEAGIRDAQREFLVRLNNVLSFFTIYANIDGFDPRVGMDTAAAAQPNWKPTGHRPTRERSELDRWIISELMRTIRDVRAAMDRFENFPAARRLNEFVDALSNWYVRRSRDRFWRSWEQRPAGTWDGDKVGGQSASTAAPLPTFPPSHIPTASDQDKWDAYHTLYGCLYTLSMLIAPFTPFFAETMYQQLVGTWESGKVGSEPREQNNIVTPCHVKPFPKSVHLCDYPAVDAALIDEELAEEMELVREIVSLGRAARSNAKLKVRQPLELVEIVLAKQEHAEWLAGHRALIAEELNIKRVEFTTSADQYVSYKVLPNFKLLGAKFRGLAQKIKPALEALPDPAAARKALLASGTMSLTVEGQIVELTPEEVEIRLEAKPGWSAAQGRAGVVVVSTELSPELLDEGKIRELIHHIQQARKEQNLAYEARITLIISAADEFLAIVRRFEETLRSECLAATVACTPMPPADATTVEVEGVPVRFTAAPL